MQTTPVNWRSAWRGLRVWLGIVVLMVVTVLLLMRPKPVAPPPVEEEAAAPTAELLPTITPLPSLTPFPTHTPLPTMTLAPTAAPTMAALVTTDTLTATAALTSTTVVTYVVKGGDTLSEIAADYQVTVDDLMVANDLADELLDVGQVLTIPPAGTAGDLVGTVRLETYVVKSGDTLGGIAARYQVSVDDLIAANDLSSDFLQLGQKLVIPAGDSD